jgi:hypothetical protein
VAHQRIGFAHPDQRRNGRQPEDNAYDDGPPRGNRKNEYRRYQTGEQNQFPVSAQD